MSDASRIRPSPRKRRTFSSPRPSMSIAPTKCFTAWKTWPGQEARFGQIVHTPSSGLIVGVPQAGHSLGGSGTGPRPLALWALAVGETTCGITSPARMTITSSPSRTSFRRRSSSLWSVASFTVTPDTCTGSSWAKGIMWPVRPTFQAMRSSLVVAVEAGDFHSIPPRLPPPPFILKAGRGGARPQGGTGRAHFVDGVVPLDVAVHAEAVLAEPVEPLVVGVELEPLDGTHAVAPDRERPRGRQLRVQLADRAGGRVAWIRVGRLAGLRALLVEAGESRQRQVDLASDLQ